jgi:hypothetical protein
MAGTGPRDALPMPPRRAPAAREPLRFDRSYLPRDRPSTNERPEAGEGFFIAADILALVSAECGLDGLPRRARADARAARASALAFFSALPCPPSSD